MYYIFYKKKVDGNDVSQIHAQEIKNKQNSAFCTTTIPLENNKKSSADNFHTM